jgi:hypothetical protein
LAWPDRFRKRRSCSLPFLLAAVVGYWVLVLAGAFSGAELAVSELGVSGSNAGYLRVVSIAAVLFTGVIIAQIIARSGIGIASGTTRKWPGGGIAGGAHRQQAEAG